MADRDEPFLNRWSRRKRAVEDEAPAPAEVRGDAPPAEMDEEQRRELEANRAAAEACLQRPCGMIEGCLRSAGAIG